MFEETSVQSHGTPVQKHYAKMVSMGTQYETPKIPHWLLPKKNERIEPSGCGDQCSIF
jgi:hypothetical protein